MSKRIWICIAVLLLISSSLLWLDRKSDVGILNLYKETEKQAAPAAQLDRNKKETKAEEVKEEPAQLPVEEPPSFLVVIDPGHQAKANLEMETVGPGAEEQKYKVTGGTTGVVTRKPEYVLNLEASLLLQEMLEEKGIKVVLTRTSHDVNISNKERAEIANGQKADLFIRLHADGSENPATKGFSILVPGKDNPYTSSIFSQSEAAANTILKIAREQVAIHDSGLFYRNDMTGFNWSKVPVILLEIGFMTNAEEDPMLSDPAYLKRVTGITAQGIVKYAGAAN